MRNSREGYGPVVTERLEPNIPGSTHPGTRPPAQPAEPKWLPVLGSARAPLDLVPELPMKSWFAIMVKEATRIAEILTPADFIGHHGKPPYINPGSRSILKSQMGRGTDPGGLEWRSLYGWLNP